MARRNREGICQICGKLGEMSFEHIPPQSVGNIHRSKTYSIPTIVEKTNHFDITQRDGVRYRQQQQGSGFATICNDCNSYLGAHYVNEFKTFYCATAQLFSDETVIESANRIHLETDKANVLALFKHMISNLCATTQPGTMLDCREFLLDCESNAFPKHYRLFIYAVPDKKSPIVTTGWMHVNMSRKFTSYYTVAHVAMFPVGFALVDLDASTSVPDDIGCDITTMSSQPWGFRPCLVIELPYMKLDAGLPTPV